MYTVKQLADLAGVSVRTLHYYDEIKLLEPTTIGDNGYRYYGDESLLRLQQILFYREMDMGLLQIKDVLDAPDFELVRALREHRDVLEHKITRLQQLRKTVDSTIMHLAGEVAMSEEHFFDGFTEAQQQKYTEEARELYGRESVDAAVERWESYSAEKKQQIQAEGNAQYLRLTELMAAGAAPDEDAVQALLVDWHNHIRYFYEPSPETLRGLGHLYNEHPDFMATFQKFHPDLPPYLEQAITIYCDRLDDALLAEWLAEDTAG